MSRNQLAPEQPAALDAPHRSPPASAGRLAAAQAARSGPHPGAGCGPSCAGGQATRTRRGTLLKALTWRVVATADTFLLSYLITGSIRWAGSIGLAEFATKFLLYYLHERAWSARLWSARQAHPAACLVADNARREEAA